ETRGYLHVPSVEDGVLPSVSGLLCGVRGHAIAQRRAVRVPPREDSGGIERCGFRSRARTLCVVRHLYLPCGDALRLLLRCALRFTHEGEEVGEKNIALGCGQSILCTE